MFRVVMHVSEVAGVLSLFGLSVVVLDVVDLPLWIPVVLLVAALLAVAGGTLQGAWVLHHNSLADARSAVADRESAREQLRATEAHLAIEHMRPKSGGMMLIVNSSATGNGGDGFHASGGASMQVIGSRAIENSGHGFYLGAGHDASPTNSP